VNWWWMQFPTMHAYIILKLQTNLFSILCPSLSSFKIWFIPVYHWFTLSYLQDLQKRFNVFLHFFHYFYLLLSAVVFTILAGYARVTRDRLDDWICDHGAQSWICIFLKSIFYLDFKPYGFKRTKLLMVLLKGNGEKFWFNCTRRCCT
jgi:hypothetical protein